MTVETPPVPAGVVGKLVDGYVKLRDKKAALKARHDAEMAPLIAMMDKIEVHLLQAMQEQGVTSYKADAGTAYAQTRTSVSTADSDAFFRFCIDTGNTHLMEKRAAKTQVEEFVNAGGDLPPGLNYRRELVVNIRRS
jgi:hypothetical protein